MQPSPTFSKRPGLITVLTLGLHFRSFLVNFMKLFRTAFYRTPLDNCFQIVTLARFTNRITRSFNIKLWQNSFRATGLSLQKEISDMNSIECKLIVIVSKVYSAVTIRSNEIFGQRFLRIMPYLVSASQISKFIPVNFVLHFMNGTGKAKRISYLNSGWEMMLIMIKMRYTHGKSELFSQ